MFKKLKGIKNIKIMEQKNILFFISYSTYPDYKLPKNIERFL